MKFVSYDVITRPLGELTEQQLDLTLRYMLDAWPYAPVSRAERHSSIYAFCIPSSDPVGRYSLVKKIERYTSEKILLLTHSRDGLYFFSYKCNFPKADFIFAIGADYASKIDEAYRKTQTNGGVFNVFDV